MPQEQMQNFNVLKKKLLSPSTMEEKSLLFSVLNYLWAVSEAVTSVILLYVF